jgi:ferredoxin
MRPAALCIGCGACTQVCPTGAIHIEDRDGVRRTIITGTVVREQPLLVCSECGAPTQTPAHREFVRQRLPDHMAALLDRELCPSCARQGFDVIRTVQALEERLQHIRTPMSLSVLGCVVNGPGEARETDIGITGGGNGKHMVYLSGVTDHHVQDEGMIDHIVRLVEAKAAEIEAATAVPQVVAAE